MKLYTTPPSILNLVTLVQRTQAWPSANSARCQTESYSVHPYLLLVGSLFLLSAACILDGRAQLYSSKLSYSLVVIHFSSCKKKDIMKYL